MNLHVNGLYVVKIGTSYLYSGALKYNRDYFNKTVLRIPHLIRVQRIDLQKNELIFEFPFAKQFADKVKLRKILFTKVHDLYTMFVPACDSLIQLYAATPLELYPPANREERYRNPVRKSFIRNYHACCIESIRVYDDFLKYSEVINNYIYDSKRIC